MLLELVVLFGNINMNLNKIHYNCLKEVQRNDLTSNSRL